MLRLRRSLASPTAAPNAASWLNRAGLLVMLVWLTALVGGVVKDQLALWPPPPPTPEETAAATPRARADWAVVYPRLAARVGEPLPEVGEVWATRAGRICGFVNHRQTAVDGMQRFYTVGLRPRLQHDDEAAYRRVWVGCINSRWVELHAGSEKTGFCAVARGRRSVLGRVICAGWTP
jgi:hypothetical protein